MAELREILTSRAAAVLLGGAMAWFAGGPAAADTVRDTAGGTDTVQLAAMDSDINEIKTAGNVRYACTGVGEEGRDDPQWNRFPAKLVFATSRGAYLSNVAVRVTDKSSGEAVFDGGCEYAPWLLLDLPAGSYEVTAEAEDAQAKTVTLDVGGSGQTERTVHFETDQR